MFGYGTDFGRLDFDQTRRKRPRRLGFNGCGFAAAQCGKALPYRQLSKNDWRLRLRFMRRSLMK